MNIRNVAHAGALAAACSLLVATPSAAGADDPQQWDPCRVIGTWPDCDDVRSAISPSRSDASSAGGPRWQVGAWMWTVWFLDRAGDATADVADSADGWDPCHHIGSWPGCS